MVFSRQLKKRKPLKQNANNRARGLSDVRFDVVLLVLMLYSVTVILYYKLKIMYRCLFRYLFLTIVFDILELLSPGIFSSFTARLVCQKEFYLIEFKFYRGKNVVLFPIIL